MPSNEIVVYASCLEDISIVDPSDRAFWESIGDTANGRHALIIGRLDDAIVIPGTLKELARTAKVISGRVAAADVIAGRLARLPDINMYPQCNRSYRIGNSLMTGIDAGVLADGEMMPPLSQLAGRYGVSSGTVKRALEFLVRCGAVTRERDGYRVQRDRVKRVLRTVGTGPLVESWLRAGQALQSGGNVPAGEAGIRFPGDFELWDRPSVLADLGDRIAQRFNSPRVQAVAAMADSIDSCSDTGMSTLPGTLSCIDADRMALALALYGHTSTAEKLLVEHSNGDTVHDDRHGAIRDAAAMDLEFGVPEDEGKAFPAAREYLKQLIEAAA